jgi:hypothetical protein
VPDFLDEKRKEITDRLRELKPAVDEHKRLEAAAAALSSVRGSVSAIAAPKRRGPGRPRGSSTRAKARATAKTTTTKVKRKKPGRPPGRRKAGRRKGSGTRAAQALSFVQGQPGITIPELAAKMGIKQNYLYRVLPALEQEGKIRKQGRGWHPKG